MRLLFHNHADVFVDSDGYLHLSANIGVWLDHLANKTRTVVLLMHHSAQLTAKQDYRIKSKNVEFESLGIKKGYKDSIKRRKEIKEVCARVSKSSDVLLIRGMTPKQKVVFDSVNCTTKVYLLVRSPKQKRLINLSPYSWIGYIANKIREREFISIGKKCNLLITNSKENVSILEETLKRDIHFGATNTITRKDALPLAHYADDAFEIEKSQTIQLLFVGRVCNLKGIRELVESVPILAQRNITVKVHFVGDEVLPDCDVLRSKITNLNITKNIEWHGRINFGPDLFKLYDMSDIFVLPTYSEGFPRVYWEASARCLPTIISGVGGIPYMLTNQVNAILIKPNSSTDIADSVEYIVNNNSMSKTISLNARMLLEQYFVDNCANTLIEIISDHINTQENRSHE